MQWDIIDDESTWGRRRKQHNVPHVEGQTYENGRRRWEFIDDSKSGQSPIWIKRYQGEKPYNSLLVSLPEREIDFVAMVGEFIGTTMFLFFAFAGTQIANLNNNSPPPTASQASATSTVDTSNLMFIALSFGFSLMVNVWVFFRISGGLFNPAISLALALVKAITPARAVLLVVAQLLGGITAAALINALLHGSLYVRTRLGGDISTAQGI